MRLGNSAVKASISPDLSLNWVFFAGTSHGPTDFTPPAVGIPAAGELRAEPQWLRWRQQVWETACGRGEPSPRGLDAPEFTSLNAAPAQQQRCVERWPLFLRWWAEAKPTLITVGTRLHVIEALSAPRVLHAGLTLHTVALEAAQDLASDGGHHLVSIGLVADAAELSRWLAAQLDET